MSHSFTFVHRQQQERTQTARVKLFQGAMKVSIKVIRGIVQG
jgi:hypothetical protein